LDGLERDLQPPPRDDEPYAAERPLLPKSLSQALDALEREPLFKKEFGEVFINYYLKLKRSELGRYQQFLKAADLPDSGESPTQWEQNEYFDFF
jgi:glutamine synthetase